MDRLTAMRVFVKVAELQGFAGAARALHMSAPAVTRAVSGLEQLLGVALLVRTTRAVKLTESGARYLLDCQRILADVERAEAAAGGLHAKPSGTLVVTASVMFGQTYVLPILLEYLESYPEVTGQALFVDRVTNMVDEGIDVSVRIGHLPDSGLQAVRVGYVRTVLCASPDYLARHGTPAAIRDLADHRIVASTAGWASPEWRFADGATVRVSPVLWSNMIAPVTEAALRGQGITRALSYQVGPMMADGRLVPLLEEAEPDPLPVHIVHAEGRSASAKVRSFVDLAAERLRANPVLALKGP